MKLFVQVLLWLVIIQVNGTSFNKDNLLELPFELHDKEIIKFEHSTISKIKPYCSKLHHVMVGLICDKIYFQHACHRLIISI